MSSQRAVAEVASDPVSNARPRSPLGAAAEWVGDRLNPILVKETRQALKSKQFTLWFVLLLIACWITTLGAIAIVGPSIFYVSAGKYLLYAYYVILALPLLVVVPFSAYRSLSSEHEENTRDLLEVSTLTPRQVINGKLGSAVVQIVVYLSALAPCIAFTYLLRGVELAQIALLLVYVVFASLGLSAVGLVLAAATRQKYAQVVISVALAGLLFACFAGLLTGASELLSLDAVELRSDWFWWLNLGMLSLYATTLAIAYAAAIALTTFTSANRSTALRLALIAQQTAFVAWVAGLIAAGMPRDGVVGAFFVATVYWFVAGSVLSSEAPTLSMRVRRSLPQSFVARAFGSWFSPGGGSGYVFVTTNLASLAVLAVLSGRFVNLGGAATTIEDAKVAGLLTAYLVAYLGFGRLTAYGLRRVANVSLLGCFLIQVLVALGGTGLPYVMQTLSDRLRVRDLSVLSLPSWYWNVGRIENGQMGPSQQMGVLIVVGSAAAILFLINLVMAGAEARQLRVAAPRRVLEDDLELNPAPEPREINPWGDRAEPTADAVG